MADTPPTDFGDVHVLEPTQPHTHTAILLHGRGSHGEEFAEELAETLMSDNKTIMQALPTWRWVFPSSRELWSPVFEESMPAWFEAYSLTDITERQDLQTHGIRDSVKHVEGIWEAEVERLGGMESKVVVGGISQGGAIGIWTMLCIKSKRPTSQPAGFIGASTWLPFAADIEHALSGKDEESENKISSDFVRSMIGQDVKAQSPMPVFLGHGTDDAYVDVELGRQAKDVISRVGWTVDWNEYSGADQEGHWIKGPEEVDDIVLFLRSVAEQS
ncbi:hypothetical protein FGSG_09154 [Fusarium graminearum PH-1]|uniref:Chromosome 4, complete genome n=1 Tax=Gibberella zeae (strain ATCC MYA-4620 / CBS 123657 / FGSC 9075 / NRRL 31084 / PH-1) TaxID=229533 RepID=I1RXS9_GIBZE|nr:hypothetical protein FGSG_09154 [Fusarium graminearum PH-1]ESU15685.1 hypothetical protein FGSG_09154 [Fusarium graminearum PH-1]CEF84672.1 unnamed protein product [Fusarium graminearum]|eukprot:XP_011328631.1 hypothetical protein FGSG_09154 [Fusarium graminearum PH-1]